MGSWDSWICFSIHILVRDKCYFWLQEHTVIKKHKITHWCPWVLSAVQQWSCEFIECVIVWDESNKILSVWGMSSILDTGLMLYPARFFFFPKTFLCVCQCVCGISPLNLMQNVANIIGHITLSVTSRWIGLLTCIVAAVTVHCEDLQQAGLGSSKLCCWTCLGVKSMATILHWRSKTLVPDSPILCSVKSP